MDKQQRNHISSILTTSIKSAKHFSPFFIVGLFKGKDHIFGLIGVFLIICLIMSFIKWYKTKFYIKQDMLVYETGILEKKTLNIPMNKIATVDLGQTIFQRIFGTYRLKLDSGSAKSEETEIDIVLKNNIAFEVRDIIGENIRSFEEEDNNDSIISEGEKINTTKTNVFKVSVKELLLSAITRNNIAFGIGIFFSVFAFFDKIKGFLNIKLSKQMSDLIQQNIIDSKSVTQAAIGIIIMMLIFIMISIILSVVGTIIKFYNFKVYKTKEYIRIEYGLFSKKTYSLPINSIHAIKLKQNIIKQKFNLYNVEVSTVGYGNEKNEEAVLYPIANKKMIHQLIEKLLPEFEFKGQLNKAPKGAMMKFFTIPVISTLVLCGIATSINLKLAYSFVIIPIVIISSYLNYKNSSIGYDDKLFVATFNGLYKETTLVKVTSIQSITATSNYFQRRKDLCTYKVDFYSDKLSDIVTVKHLKNIHLRKLENLIDF